MIICVSSKNLLISYGTFGAFSTGTFHLAGCLHGWCRHGCLAMSQTPLINRGAVCIMAFLFMMLLSVPVGRLVSETGFGERAGKLTIVRK